MKPPTVSVVIPAYKAEQTIRRAIDSVLAQTVPAHEIIVVDDGSPDQQAAVVESYGPPVRLIRQPNGKTAKARNAGLDAATGEFIAFLDADDYWEPQKLARQLAIFDIHPEVGTVAGAWFTQEPGEERTAGKLSAGVRPDRVLHLQGTRAFRLAVSLWTGTMMVRRGVLGDDRFVSGLEPAEDRDLWVRLVAKAPTYVSSEALATYSLTPGSISRSSVERDCSSMLAVVERNRNTLGPVATSQWRSHTLYRWAALEESPRLALGLLWRSFAAWPLPYVRMERMRPLGRLKRLVVMLGRLFRSPTRRLPAGSGA